MLSQQNGIISSDDDDDDYELPSLAERIKASLVLQQSNCPQNVSSSSEDEDSSFLNFSERIRSTPYSQVKVNQKDVSNKRIIKEPKILKEVEENNPPPLNIKLDFSLTSDSEDEESEFLNFSQRIQSTPQVKNPVPQNIVSCYITSESDSDDEVFANLSESLSVLNPKIENKENYGIAVRSDVKKKSDFLTPLPPEKKILNKTVDSESDESFLNFVEVLKTPMSVNRKISHKTTDSGSDESFSSFIEKIRTPLSVNRKLQNKVIDSDSDDSFLNVSRKQAFKTPRSQHKTQKDALVVPKITNKTQYQSPLSVESTPNAEKIYKNENEKEFRILFQPENIASKFLQKRESYTRMLYEFYNRKVFNSRLPPDMPLFYDGALKTTAGITHCSVKGGTYTCSIKLSPLLLNSFDHLKDTLLHEMCHAAVWIVNNQRNVQHGPLWQIWASRCKLILPFIECPKRCHNYEISYSVWYQCTKCQWKKGRCKQVRKYHGALCKKCKSPIIVTYS